MCACTCSAHALGPIRTHACAPCARVCPTLPSSTRSVLLCGTVPQPLPRPALHAEPHATCPACRQRRKSCRPAPGASHQAHLSQPAVHNTHSTICSVPRMRSFHTSALSNPFPSTLLPPGLHAPGVAPCAPYVRQVVLRLAVHHHLRGRQPIPRPLHRNARRNPDGEVVSGGAESGPYCPYELVRQERSWTCCMSR